MVGLAPEPNAYGSLRGLGELVPSTILLVGLATRPIYFVMASSTNVPRLPLLGLLDLTRSRWATLVITMWFLTWVVVEFEGGPSGPNLIWRMLFSCVARGHPESSRFLGVNECIAVSRNIKDLTKGSGGDGSVTRL
jgi:hypothetical protein